MAIELAIGVMFLLMAFTIILLTTAGLQNSSLIKDRDSFYEKVELDQIGEHVCANKSDYLNANNESITIDDLDTGYCVSDKSYVLDSGNILFEITKGDDVVLTIVMDTNGKIISWN